MTARLRPSPAPVTVSTVHLSEDRQRWTLTLSLTPELLALIDDAAQGDEPVRTAHGTQCQVHVEPNLLPGEPFEIDEIVIRSPQPKPSQPHPRNGRESS